MGGSGSGRSGGSATTESTIKLDIDQCMGAKYFRPGKRTAGLIEWSSSQTGLVVASIAFEAHLGGPEESWVRLDYSTAERGRKVEHSLLVNLVATKPHFGGLRWWFRCPRSSRRVRCLHLIGGSIASRQALGLGYRAQRESAKDQRLRVAQAIDAKLGGNGNLLAPPPTKPKWMRWATYRRLVNERERATLKSLMGSVAAYDTPATRQLLDEARRIDPDLIADL